MDGEITLESEVGVGTVFKIWLPLEPSRTVVEAPTEVPNPVSSEMKESLRILVADDNPMVNTVLRGQLTRLGYSSDSAVNGREVLEALRARPYHLVFLDCQMPVLDGYSTAREISRWDKRPVLIASTAHAMEGEREHCISVGMDDYVSKPISVEKLEQFLSSWCGEALKRQ